MICDVVVVDNASHDTSFKAVKNKEWKLPMTFVSLKHNRGFAKANNIGIEKKSMQSTSLLLLNPDTIVHPGAISTMFEALMSASNIGVVGAHLLNPDGTTQPSVRRFPTVPVFAWLLLKLARLFPYASFWQRYLMSDFNYETRTTVDQVMGAAFLIRGSLLSTVGKLSESYWIWFEEVDYCLKVWQAGFKVVYEPKARITHLGGASFSQLVGFSRVLPFLKSSTIYAFKNLGVFSGVALILMWPFALLTAVPASILHVRDKKRNALEL